MYGWCKMELPKEHMDDIVSSYMRRLPADDPGFDAERLVEKAENDYRPHIRATAAERLGYFREASAVPGLCSNLFDSSTAVNAAKALGMIGDHSAIPYLFQGIERDFGTQRGHMIDSLGMIKDAAAAPKLIKRLFGAIGNRVDDEYMEYYVLAVGRIMASSDDSQVREIEQMLEQELDSCPYMDRPDTGGYDVAVSLPGKVKNAAQLIRQAESMDNDGLMDALIELDARKRDPVDMSRAALEVVRSKVHKCDSAEETRELFDLLTDATKRSKHRTKSSRTERLLQEALKDAGMKLLVLETAKREMGGTLSGGTVKPPRSVPRPQERPVPKTARRSPFSM